MDKLLLTPEEAARALSIGRSKLYELIGSGELASVRIGASRRITVDGLATYVKRLATSDPDCEPHEEARPGSAA